MKVQYREVNGDVERIQTREGEICGYADKDYIIKGVHGEEYPCKKEIFAETYTTDNCVICGRRGEDADVGPCESCGLEVCADCFENEKCCKDNKTFLNSEKQ